MLSSSSIILALFRSKSLNYLPHCSSVNFVSRLSFRFSTIMSDESKRLENVSDTSKSVYVQHSEGKEMMTISFEFKHNDKSKSFNLYRKATEPLSSSFDRIKLSLAKFIKSKKHKKGAAVEDSGDNELPLQLFLNNSLVDPKSVRNVDVWIEGAVLKLNGYSYIVKRNEPQVTIMKLPSIIMKGFITLPSVDLANCSLNECQFRWYRQITSQEHEELQINKDFSNKLEFHNQSYWLHLATGLTYSPTDDDVAHHLKVICHPSNGSKIGPNYSCLSGRPVELGPPACSFEKRHALTSDRLETSEKIRCVSYNILADLYADSDYSRNVLFAHCPAHALEIDYRRQLLLKEIHGYNADIVCLQEVDKKEFIRTYKPYFQLVSHREGVYDTKGGQVAEGVATFFREDKFELIDSHKTILSSLIDPVAPVENEDGEATPQKEQTTDGENLEPQFLDYNIKMHPILKDPTTIEAQKLLSKMDDIRAKILCKPALQKRFMGRNTIIQTNLLKLKGRSNTYVIVANTHLYYAPDADHIRLLQGSVCVKYLEFIKNHYRVLIVAETKIEQPQIMIIFCGDMNSSPDCGLFKLLHEGRVDDTLVDWASNKEESVDGLSVETNLRFSSAYTNIPYTNYTPGFNGCLDYIYYEKNSLECESVVPLPDHEDVIATEGIPSDVFPSDHLALIANLNIKN